MHILVAHGPRRDAAARIAKTIGRRLEGHGMSVHTVASRDVVEFHRFDAVVVGSSLCAGKWSSECVKLLKQLAREEFCGPIWLFHSSSLTDEACPDGGMFPKRVIVYADRLDVRDWVTFDPPAGTTDADESHDWREAEVWADQIASVVTDEIAA